MRFAYFCISSTLISLLGSLVSVFLSSDIFSKASLFNSSSSEILTFFSSFSPALMNDLHYLNLISKAIDLPWKKYLYYCLYSYFTLLYRFFQLGVHLFCNSYTCLRIIRNRTGYIVIHKRFQIV